MREVMSVPRFFVPDAGDAGQLVTLPDDEAHHLRHVLRLGAGAELAVFDGRGHEWTGRVARAEKRGPVVVELLDVVKPVPEPSVRVTLGMGLVKGEHMDAIVRDATALGVSEIAPFLSDHVAVPSQAWKKSTPEVRWHRVAVAAAKQCGRAVVPAIAPLQPFAALLDRADAGLRLMAVEPAMSAGTTTTLGPLARLESTLVLVGPEGGWSEREVQLARERGVALINLGPRRLTAELAPVVLLSALRTLWGW
jgi:16S rRNA (uracil1498-N3)-methyltransferase